MQRERFNVLLCLDDFTGDYTRHCAVTIISLLETNEKHKIKIFIISSCLPEENIEELKRIVKLYNQEIEFIIHDNIIPGKLKDIIINPLHNLTRGAWYRLFFSLYIKGIDRILYMDCDVLVTKDIEEIYCMDMKGKAIAGYHDVVFACFKNENFKIKNYINSGVLLFDTKTYNVNKINIETIKKINNIFGKYIHTSDQDYLNLIFKDDILIAKEGINYQIINKYFNKGINNAEIIHCLEKPYVQYSNIPKKYKNLYYHYLSMTKWKNYPQQKADCGILRHLYNCFYIFCSHLLLMILGEKNMKTVILFMQKFRNYI